MNSFRPEIAFSAAAAAAAAARPASPSWAAARDPQDGVGREHGHVLQHLDDEAVVQGGDAEVPQALQGEDVEAADAGRAGHGHLEVVPTSRADAASEKHGRGEGNRDAALQEGGGPGVLHGGPGRRHIDLRGHAPIFARPR